MSNKYLYCIYIDEKKNQENNLKLKRALKSNNTTSFDKINVKLLYFGKLLLSENINIFSEMQTKDEEKE